MKLIISGGRNRELTFIGLAFLDHLLRTFKITHVYHGGASGIDEMGAMWAEARDLNVVAFPADWDKYGPKAGPMRNQTMAIAATACVLFAGNKGTFSMRSNAQKHKLKIFDKMADHTMTRLISSRSHTYRVVEAYLKQHPGTHLADA